MERSLRLLTLSLWLVPNLLAEEPPSVAEVPPGGVVRWLGEGLESCSSGDRQWEPLAGACWYPVPLTSAAAPLEVSRRAGGRVERLSVRVADYPYAIQELTIEDETRVHLSVEDLARVERENARIATLWDRETDRGFSLPLGPPLAGSLEGGRFGAKRIINGEPRSPHSGVDYAADRGDPVFAVGDGLVLLAEEHFFAGNSVFIDHGDELISMYFHLSEIEMAAGQRVSRGELIGRVGATGRATGPHLHFGIRWHGARIDPGPLLGLSQPVTIP